VPRDTSKNQNPPQTKTSSLQRTRRAQRKIKSKTHHGGTKTLRHTEKITAEALRRGEDQSQKSTAESAELRSVVEPQPNLCFTAKDAKDAKENRNLPQRSEATTKTLLPQKPQRNTKGTKFTAEAAGSAEKTQRRILSRDFPNSCLVAVGTGIAPCPPHRSVRAHFSAYGSYLE